MLVLPQIKEFGRCIKRDAERFFGISLGRSPVDSDHTTQSVGGAGLGISRAEHLERARRLFLAANWFLSLQENDREVWGEIERFLSCFGVGP